MSQLDIRTLAFIAHLVALALAVVFAFVAKGNRISGRPMSIWGLAFLIRSMGFALIFLRPTLPAVISLFLANALVLLSYQLVLIGFQDFLGRRFHWELHGIFSAIIVLELAVLFQFGNYHIFVSGLTIPPVAIDLVAAGLLLRGIPSGMVFFQRSLALLFGLEAAIFLCRMGWHLSGPSQHSLFDPALMVVVVYIELVLNTVLLGASLLALVYQRAHNKKLELIAELEATLAKVHTLEGLLPMCAWCKKIRDEDGSWHSVEEYVSDHTDAAITHGICPECRARFQS